MQRTLKRASLAYFLLFTNFNLSLMGFSIPCLPNALGWYFLLQVLGDLQPEAPNLRLLANPAMILLVLSLEQFVPNLQTAWPLVYTFVFLFGNLLSLYFHFQFLTNLGALLASRCVEIQTLYRCRTALCITTTITAVTGLFGPDFMVIPMIISFGAGIWIASILKQLSNCDFRM